MNVSMQDWEWFSDTWKGLFLALIPFFWTIYVLITR